MFYLNFLVLFIFSILYFKCSYGLLRKVFNTKSQIYEGHGDPGEPLFLTQYIEKGDIETGQALSEVKGLTGSGIKSHSGFLTVNKRYKSNMFFWFIPSLRADPRDPLVVWLQGGPGGSSLFGLFVENGPFFISKNYSIYEREYPWNAKYNLLYIDNPVGTGFSFSDIDGYAKNEEDVANNLYELLIQFFELFPDLKGNHIYITGESYAGKYIPSLAYKIHTEKKPKKMYLRGIAIGNGWIDPESMISNYPEFFYQAGLFDEIQRDELTVYIKLVLKMIQNKEWKEATMLYDRLMFSDLTNETSFFFNCTGMKNYFNIIVSQVSEEFSYYSSFLNREEVRRAIHVGKLPFNEGTRVESMLVEDFMQTVKPKLIQIMNYYKVLIYNGHLDAAVPLPVTQAMLETLNWSGAQEYKMAEKLIWKVEPKDASIAGYIRRVHDFYQVVVLGAGHIVPYDQPRTSWDLIDRFISGRHF